MVKLAIRSAICCDSRIVTYRKVTTMTKGGKAKKQGYTLGEILFGSTSKPSSNNSRNSKKVNKSKNHHDSFKGGGGNNTGRRR